MKLRLATALMLLVSLPPSLRAQENGRAQAQAAAVAPFVDEQTVAVLHVDLTRVEPIVEELQRWVPEWEPNRDALLTLPQKGLELLKDSGAKELYVVVSLADIPERWPPILIPADKEISQKGLDGFIKVIHGEDTAFESVRKNDMFVVGSREVLDRIKAIKPDPRPELELAFRGAGEASVQLILIPSALHRRIVGEIMPTLPREVGGGPTAVLTEGLLWAGAGVNVSSAPKFRLTIGSQSPHSAESLRLAWRRCLRLLAANEEVQRIVPGFAEYHELLLLEVEGSSLRLVLNQQTGGAEKPAAAIAPLAAEAREAHLRHASTDRLKQIALAMHNHHDVHKTLPAPANFGPDKQPLLSWRVHVLPFLDEQKLYDEFRLDEPWDSDHNKKLIARMPGAYRSPLQPPEQEGRTTYLLAVGNGAMFERDGGTAFRAVTDGISLTIMTVEVDPKHAVVWTKPEDLQFNPEDPLAGIGRPYPDGFWIGAGDGSARLLPYSTPEETLRALFTRSGGEPTAVHRQQ